MFAEVIISGMLKLNKKENQKGVEISTPVSFLKSRVTCWRCKE